MARRLAGLVVTGEAISEFVKSGTRFVGVESPVPDTATFFTSYFDERRNAFVLVFEDDSFALVPEGDMIPILYEPCLVSRRDDPLMRAC